MYQTTIASVSGNMAADINGRSFYIAGSSMVTPGQQVWTDGKVIYGNTISGGDTFIPAMINKGYLLYDARYVKWFKENLKMNDLCISTVAQCVCGDKGDIITLGHDTVDASIGYIDDKSILYEIRKKDKDDKTISIYKNNNKMCTIDADNMDADQYIGEFAKFAVNGKGEPISFEITDRKSRVLDKALIHPDGTWNALAETEINLKSDLVEETIYKYQTKKTYSGWVILDGLYMQGAVPGDHRGEERVFFSHTLDHVWNIVDRLNPIYIEWDDTYYVIPSDYLYGYTVGKKWMEGTTTYTYYRVQQYGGKGTIKVRAVISGDCTGITDTNIILATIDIMPNMDPRKQYTMYEKKFDWKLDKTTAVYNTDSEKFEIDGFTTEYLPVDYQPIKYKNKEACLIQTARGVSLWDYNAEKDISNGYKNYNLRLRKVNTAKAKKVLESG